MIHVRFGTRIALWTGLVVALGIVLFGIAITFFIHQESVASLDRQLTAEGQRFLNEWKRHGGPKFRWAGQDHEIQEWSPAGEPPRLLEVTDPSGKVLYRSPSLGKETLAGRAPGKGQIQLGGRSVRVVSFKEDGIVLRLAADLAPVISLTREMAVAILLALPVVLGFVFLGGWLIARKAIGPIQEITETAERVTAQRLDQRVPVPLVKDEIHRLATVLNQTLDRLDGSFRQATRFTGDASHELKTPLTVLRTMVEALLRSPELSANDQRTVAAILEQTKRLSSITASLLLLSRADAGRLQLALAPGDLVEIIGLCVDDARIIAEDQRIEIGTDLPPAAWGMIDRTRSAQIIMNVLDNAVKYNHEGGRVRVSLTKANSAWCIRIANTGPGIPEDARPNLFVRFFRGEHTAATGGHGLGLSLSRELARAQGGELELDAAEAGWTAFLITIPSADFSVDHASAPLATLTSA